MHAQAGGNTPQLYLNFFVSPPRTRSRHADVEYQDNPDEYIMLDETEAAVDQLASLDEGSENEGGWAPLWKQVRTSMVIEPPKEIQIE